MEGGDKPLNWRNSMKARTGVGEEGGKGEEVYSENCRNNLR